MEQIFDSLHNLPMPVVLLVVFLFFMLKLFELIVNWLGQIQKSKSDGGVSHLTIYEKIGEQHGTLLMLLQKIETMEKGVEKFERDFKLHTEADEKFAKTIIEKLDAAVKRV